jgi:hypothetical protein
MSRFVLISIFVLVVLLLFSGCSSGPDEINASWGREFTLSTGQTAVFDGGRLKIKFESVTGDSRCPKGVTCIQAGEAKCKVLIGNDRSYSAIELHDKAGMSGYSETTFENTGYKIKLSFRVEPYPEAGKQIGSSDYKLLMTVIKQG